MNKQDDNNQVEPGYHQFDGFNEPKANYSKLPHILIDTLPLIDSLAEMKVVLYVLRHTWGFQEFDEAKRITMDEFCNGRKKSDGSRLDKGTGMTRNAIKDGIRRALFHGFLLRDGDGKDYGRSSFVYILNARSEDTGSTFDPLPENDTGSKVDPQGVNLRPPESQKLTPRRSKVDSRSEKDTLKDTKKQNNKKSRASGAPASSGNGNGGIFPDGLFPEEMTGDENEPAPPPLTKEEKMAFRAELVKYFRQQTGLPAPLMKTQGQLKETQRLWWSPLDEVANLAKWDLETAKEIIDQALTKLGDLTISDPNSTIKTVRAVYGQQQRWGVSPASHAAIDW